VTEFRDLSLTEQNEQHVRDYFEKRPGWTVANLDTGKRRAADFRVCDGSDCFLCEVKTVKSARANYPFTSLDFYRDQRLKRRAEIERSKRIAPDRCILMPRDEYEFLYGDETEFDESHRWLSRHTQKYFVKFAQGMRQHFTGSRVGHLPYRLRLDSDDLYVPDEEGKAEFFGWLEGAIEAIDTGTPGWQWGMVGHPFSCVPRYSAFYRFPVLAHNINLQARYQLLLEGPFESGGLEIHVHFYGCLNLDAITSSVLKGLQQLESSALREENRRIPRIIALALDSPIGFEDDQLISHVKWLLHEHSDLSATAIMRWTPNGTPPPLEIGIEDWAKFIIETPVVVTFTVLHNPDLDSVDPLPWSVFDEEHANQISG
jgi:hypothetical protein